MTKRVKLGDVHVESGTLLILDPYILLQDPTSIQTSVKFFQQSKAAYHEIMNGMGVLFRTAHGDGIYKVNGIWRQSQDLFTNGIEGIEIDFS